MATPKIIPYTVKLRSVVPEKTFIKPPVVYTNDLRSAEFQFKITDMDASELLTATAKTMLYMRDGSFFQNPSTDVSRVGNVFSYLLKENEGNHAGIAKIQLVVYFNEGLANEQNFPTQLYEFEIINGLETKVAQEVMIYDWTTLTRDARAYIDEFVANEILREAEFDNNEFDRNAAFNQAQTSRTTAYGIAEAARDADYEENEALRQAGYDADHSRADTDHTRAENDSELAGTDHTRADSDSDRAGTDHTRAEADHTRADTDSDTVAGFNGRLTAEETATANNKISSVKGKTFADVDARLEDVEFDTTMMGTNLVTNGDVSNDTTGWSGIVANLSSANNTLSVTGDGSGLDPRATQTTTLQYQNGDKVYVKANCKVTNSSAITIQYRLTATGMTTQTVTPKSAPALNENYSVSFVIPLASGGSGNVGLQIVHTYTDAATANGKVMEVKNIIAINLTAAFGKGNEPTAEQMDGILAKFTNSWFNGTANLFRANATLNKLMAVDARTEFEAKNSLSNGDFSNGTTGWGKYNSNISVANNVLSVTGDGTSMYTPAYNTTSLIATVGNKLYSKCLVRSTSATLPSLELIFQASSGGSQVINALAAAAQNAWYAQSFISAIPSGSSGNVQLKVQSKYADAPTSNGQTMEIKYVILIDLTATFGAGKEPTLAEMDRLMARFPNSWFDGVKPIQTIETLYQEKANKVQEAWITPTLTNGWIQKAGFMPIGYMKDELGFVHIRGMVDGTGAVSGSTAFTLPIGYRPLSSTYCIGNGSGVFASVPIATDGTVKITSAQIGWVSLEGITFKV